MRLFCLGTIALMLATTSVLAQGGEVAYTGTVTAYTPGETIVIRDINNMLVTYALTPDMVVPADVQVGRTVTYYTDRSGTGTLIRNVTTTSLTAAGNLKTTTERTTTMPDGSTTTTTGTVVEYVPTKSLVIRGADNKLVTYLLPPGVALPVDVEVGKTVTLYVEPGDSGPAVRKVTTTTSRTDDGRTKTMTESIKTLPDGSTFHSTGTVVEYVPRQRVVIRGSDDKVVTHKLRRAAILAPDVEVGKTVSIYYTNANGAASVSRVTTTSVTPEGEQKTTTRTTEISPAGNKTTTMETSVEGVVSGYMATKSVTVERADGSSATYELNRDSTIPSDLVIGSRVMLKSLPGGQLRVVRNITYTNTVVN